MGGRNGRKKKDPFGPTTELKIKCFDEVFPVWSKIAGAVVRREREGSHVMVVDLMAGCGDPAWGGTALRSMEACKLFPGAEYVGVEFKRDRAAKLRGRLGALSYGGGYPRWDVLTGDFVKWTPELVRRLPQWGLVLVILDMQGGFHPGWLEAVNRILLECPRADIFVHGKASGVKRRNHNGTAVPMATLDVSLDGLKVDYKSLWFHYRAGWQTTLLWGSNWGSLAKKFHKRGFIDWDSAEAQLIRRRMATVVEDLPKDLRVTTDGIADRMYRQLLREDDSPQQLSLLEAA